MDNIISLPAGVERPKPAKRALIIVDMQKDFMPSMLWSEEEKSGALPVAGGLDIVPNIVKEAYSGYDLVVATRDFHPPTHVSFKEVGGLWPMHCVAGSEGADLLREIDMMADIIISKGTDTEKEAYSGFETEFGSLTKILSDLQEWGGPPADVTVVGVATDYCVRHTAFGAFARGWPTTVLLDCIAGVEEETTNDTLIEMQEAGITLRTRE
jgi:nicotinamidase/pyrazinamidase